MGQHAQDAVYEAIEEEHQRDLYCSGDMDMYEAFDRGFLNSTGAEVDMQDAWERSRIGTIQQIDDDIESAIKDLEISTLHQPSTQVPEYSEEFMYQGEVVEVTNKPKGLNQEAINNLSKDCPTCNCCREEMMPRMGKYGKFYYCMNSCKGQKCVSDKYWQSVKK